MPDILIISLPHIRLYEFNSNQLYKYMRIVEDVELGYFIDDYLTEECDLAGATSSAYVGGENNVVYYFPESVDVTQLVESLNKIDKEEIERIYAINNPNV